MMLFILLSSLFAQLASAGIFSSPEPDPFYKVIYDKGHLITNSLSIRELDVEHIMDVLLFRFHHTKTYGPHDYAAIVSEENDWLNMTFVIQSEPMPMDKATEEAAKNCETEHTGPEKKLIKGCYGFLKIRFTLDADELMRVQESRKVLADPVSMPTIVDEELRFKITYNKGVMTSESVELQQLKVEKEQGAMVVQAFVEESNAGFISLKDVEDSLKTEQFVVESLPLRSNVTCNESLPNLIYFCTGLIRLREMTANEKAKY